MLKTVLLCTQHILIVLDSSSACALVLTRDCSNATILFLILSNPCHHCYNSNILLPHYTNNDTPLVHS